MESNAPVELNAMSAGEKARLPSSEIICHINFTLKCHDTKNWYSVKVLRHFWDLASLEEVSGSLPKKGNTVCFLVQMPRKLAGRYIRHA